jgi:hypothetical protein
MSKRIFLVLLAVLFIGGTAFAATSGNRTSPGRGEIVQMPFQSDPPKRFRLVRWVGAGATESTLAKDSIVVWDTTLDDGITINTTTTSYDSSVAGILVTAALTQDTVDNTAVEDIGKDNWAWLQTYGLSQVDIGASQNVEAGGAMGTSTTAGGAGRFLASTSASTAEGYAGFYFDAAAAGATDVECFVRCE